MLSPADIIAAKLVCRLKRQSQSSSLGDLAGRRLVSFSLRASTDVSHHRGPGRTDPIRPRKF